MCVELDCMKILFVASEVTPLIKSGGLADVVGGLPLALAKQGHDVRVAIPAYHGIDKEQLGVRLVAENDFQAGNQAVSSKVFEGSLAGSVGLYLVEFEPGLARPALYPRVEDGDQDRFVIFGLTVLEWLRESQWQPHLIHGHDWMTGSLMAEIKHRRLPYGTVLTVHNGAYQGLVAGSICQSLGLDYDQDESGMVNLLQVGLEQVDRITTVSQTYARELIELGGGHGLEATYRSRQVDTVGIINGIDSERFNPWHNPYVQPGYNARTVDKAKQQHKHLLQIEFGLPAKRDLPLFGMVGRATPDKGFDLIAEVISSTPLLEQAQVVILASPEVETVEKDLKHLVKKYPQNLHISVGFDEAMAHRMYAACDFFIMPSRREPCGLVQLIAMKYGAIPIVHKTGGLADTVVDIRDGDKGTGIVFSDYAAQGLGNALGRSMGLYYDHLRMPGMVKRVMKQDWSWDRTVGEYEAVYESLVRKEE